MKAIEKTKLLLKAAVVVAILVAFVMPGTAVISKTPMLKQSVLTPHEGKNLLMQGEWVEQATGFTTPSRGIGYVYVVNENIVWAAAYDGTAPTAPCQEFTKTVNGGALWTPGFISGASGLSLAMIFALDETTAWVPLYAATTGVQGIYQTTDGGAHWARQTSASFSGSGAFPNCVHFWDASVGWCMGDPVGGYYEIYTTTDGGTTWVRVPQGDIPAPLSGEYGVVGYYDVVGDTIWFGTTYGRVYKSVDRGLHWTVVQTTLSAYIKPAFKDANNGLVIDLNAGAIAYLAETSDGGATWMTVDYVGTCYDNDLAYVPGTDNMYISTGAATGASGASYSLDGGHNWIDFEMYDIQMMALGFAENKEGWAGAFNTDEITGGIWKYLPGQEAPAFTVAITGGNGLTVDVKNVGEIPATNVVITITIEGGLFVTPREITWSEPTLNPGNITSKLSSIFGIGLGILLPMPQIKVHVNCDEEVSADGSAYAKIFFKKVTLQ